MKLHLPKKLLAAVLSCMFAAEATYAATYADSTIENGLPNVININFAGDQAGTSGKPGLVLLPCGENSFAYGSSAWTTVSGGTGTGTTVTDSLGNEYTLTWSSPNTWGSGVSTDTLVGAITKGYLDMSSGGSASFSLSSTTDSTPLDWKQVNIIFSGDGGSFGKVEVGGTEYYYNGGTLTEVPEGENPTWGVRSGSTTLTEGVNLMCVSNTDGAAPTTLTVTGKSNGGSRATIAGFQIVLEGSAGDVNTGTISDFLEGEKESASGLGLKTLYSGTFTVNVEATTDVADDVAELTLDQDLQTRALNVTGGALRLAVNEGNTFVVGTIELGSDASLTLGGTSVAVSANSLDLGTGTRLIMENGACLTIGTKLASDIAANTFEAGKGSTLSIAGDYRKLADLKAVIDSFTGAGTLKFVDAQTDIQPLDDVLACEVEGKKVVGKKVVFDKGLVFTGHGNQANEKFTVGSWAEVTVNNGALEARRMNVNVVKDGNLTANAGILIGHPENGEYSGWVNLSGGEIVTTFIKGQNNHVGSAFTMTGGTLTITGADAFGLKDEGKKLAVKLQGGTIRTTMAQMNLTGDAYAGSGNLVFEIGNVTFDTGEGHTINLNHAFTQTGTLTVTGSGTLTVSGAVTLGRDSAMGVGAQVRDVQITGNVSGDHKLAIVQGTGIDFTGGMDLGTLELASDVSIDISGTAATVGTIGNTGAGAQATVTGTTLTISGLYAGSSNILTTGEGGQIVFGSDAAIDVSNLTAEGASDFTVDGFIQESYRVTASGVNASISGGTIALVKDGASLGSATWSDGSVTMDGIVYNVVTRKSYNDYRSEAEAAGKTATSILVQEGGTFVATRTDQTIAIAGTGTLSAQWNGRAQAGDVISKAAKSFSGDVVVESGASWLIGNGYSFSSITVESGGQFGLDGTYTGDITISGTGTAVGEDQQGALKFGDGGTLTGNVTVSGNKAALSTWDSHAGTINGNINCATEGGAELEILNSATPTITTNTITVTGNLSGIKQVATTAASMTVGGTIGDFGDTFTKRGAGTLTITKNGAVNGGNVVVAEGTVSLGSTGGTAILNHTEVTVLEGAALILEHDALGWSGDNITKALTLQGKSETERALLYNKDNASNTLKTVINMNGHSRIENAGGNTGGKFNTLSGFKLNAAGTDNEIASEIQVRNGFVIDISNMTCDSELTISGKISTHGEGSGGLTKTGGGTLILTNTGNDVGREIAIHGGTLKLVGAGVKHGSGTLNMSKDDNVEVSAGNGGNTTLSNSITGRGNLIVSSGTLTLDGSNAVSLDNIYVSAGAGMIIDGTKTIDSTTGTGGVNVMGTIYSDGTLTVNGTIIMESTDHLAGENFSDGANGRYVGGVVNVVQGMPDATDTNPNRLGGTGTITIGNDTFDVGSIAAAGGNNVEANNFTWHHDTGILTYLDSKSETDTHAADAYYINVGTVTYGAEGNTAATDTDATKLILDGGTLKITSAVSLNKSVEALSDSTLYIDEKAEVNRSSITAGRNHVRLAGTGTYTISDEHSATAPTVEVNMEGDWRGWVKLRNVAANQLNLNNYGARLELSGLFKDQVGDSNGYLKTGTTTFTSDIRLTASDGGGAAIYLRNGNDGDHHIFSGKISGKGDIVRDESPGTHKTLEFTGDVSDWKGKFTSSHGNNSFTTTLEFRDGATKIYAGVEATSNSIVNVTIHNDLDVVCGDSQDTEDKSGKIAINQTAGGTLTTSGQGNKDFYGNVAAKKLVTSGGRATFAKGATFDTTSLSNRNGQSIGTAKNVTIDGTQLTGAGADVETLGKLVSLDVAFAAAVNVTNVVMQDVTLKAAPDTNGTVTYSNAKAVAATATPTAAAAPVLYAADTSSDTSQTLTAMAVQSGGTASGTLTIDVTNEILRTSFGRTLKWTFLDQVTLGSDFKVVLGDILAGIVSDGLPKVTLTVGDGPATPLTDENVNNITTATGGLLAGTTGAVNVVLTIENVPEPATATLSLLALAALAARRRRKK